MTNIFYFIFTASFFSELDFFWLIFFLETCNSSVSKMTWAFYAYSKSDKITRNNYLVFLDRGA